MSGNNTPDSKRTSNFKKPDLLIEQLEDRVLFDAVPAPVDVQDVESNLAAQLDAITQAFTTDESASTQQTEANREVVFVDKSVEGFSQVVADFANNHDVDVFFINSGSDGIEQIANHLEGRNDLDAIHIISHGNEGQLSLGGSVIESGDLESNHGTDLVRIGQALSQHGDILIYGCNLGDSPAGESFVQSLSNLTGADVAASDDITGHESLGGDWELEISKGTIEAKIIVSEEMQQRWIGALETYGELVGVDVSAGSDGNQPANWSHLTGAGTVTNLTDETGASTGISLTLGTTGTLTGYSAAPDVGNLPTHSNDLSGIDDGFYDNSGGTEEITLTWSGLNAGAEYAVYTFSTAGFQALQTITYTGGNGTVSHEDVFSNVNTVQINESLGSSTRTLNSYATIMTADALGQINVSITSEYWAVVSGAAIQNVTGVPADLTPDVNIAIEDTNPNPVTGNVLDNDTSNGNMTVTAVNGSAASVNNTINGNFGDFTLNADGTYTYQLDNNDPAVQALNAQDNIIYTGSHDGSDVATSTAGRIEAVNLSTGATSVVTTTTLVPYINGLASNADNNLVYYGDDDNIYMWDPTTDTHSVMANLEAIGLPAANGLLSGGATYVDGTLYIGLEPDGAGDMTGIYSLDLAADGRSVTNVTNLNVETAAAAAGIANIGGFGDMIMSGTTMYGSTTVAGFWSFDLVSGVFNQITDQYRGQLAATEDGRVFSAQGTSLQQIDLATGELTGNIIASIIEATDASSAISAPQNPTSVLTESFTYTVTDADGDVSTTTITITIGGSNDAPVAIDHSINVLQGSSNNSVGAPNPTDVDNALSELTFTIDSVPPTSQGTFTIGAGGSVVTDTTTMTSVEFSQLVFTPANGHHGSVTDLAYTVSDPRGLTDSATISVTVNGAPNATANTGSVTEDTSLSDSGNVITDNDGNGVDSDPENESFYVNQINSDPGLVGTGVVGSYGTITVLSDGSYTYVLDNNNAAVNALDNGETLSDSFTYTITDINGLESTSTVTITINGANDQPVAGGTIPNQIDEDGDTIATVDASTAFSDPDGDTLTFTATGLPTGLAISSAGLITGQIDNSASQAGTNGVYSITVIATDDNGAQVSSTFTWTITNPGPAAANDSDSTDQDTNASGNVITASDTDQDLDTLTVDAVGGNSSDVGQPVAGSNGGEFTITSTGSYNFDPSGDFDFLADGETATTSITYSITDSEGGFDSATLEITVTGTNDVPTVASAIPNQSHEEGTTIPTVDVSSYFGDVDNNADLDFTASGLPGGLSMGIDGQITGTIDINASQAGPYTVTVTATDEFGADVQQTFTWTVANLGPDAQDDSYNTFENQAVSNDVIGNDSDPDATTISVNAVDGSTANVSNAVTGSNGGQFTINSDGSFDFDPDGDFDFLRAGEVDTTSITYQITDSEGATDTATLTITVTGNDTDNDGVIDEDDVDDDNDGILDVHECAALATDSGFDGAITDLSFDITSDNPGDSSGNHFLNSIIVNGTAYSDFIVPSGFQSNYTNPGTAGIAVVENTNNTVHSYGDPNYDQNALASFQSNKINLYQRLDPSGGNEWGDGDYFLLDYNVEILSTNRMFVAITERGGNNTVHVEALDQSGNVLGSITANKNSSDYVDMGVEVHPGTYSQNAFASVFALDDIAPVGSFVSQLRVSFEAGSDAGDGKIFIFGDEITQECPDSDNDGYADHLDIDKDNDGITDNVEAQTTAGYIAPSGIDANNDGLDDIYDSGALGEADGWGLSSVDTDNDGVIDSLDDDSDNDGFTDQFESGLAAATSSADTDRDGLLDDYEGSDVNDGFDINDENIIGDDGGPDGEYTRFNLSDAEDDTDANESSPNRTDNNATPMVHDLDFRDASPNVAPDAVDDADSVTQITTALGNVLDNDSDPENNPITVTSVNSSAGNVGSVVPGSTGGDFTIASDGTYTFDPNGDFDYLSDGQTATSTITYTISDSFGATDTATVSILITGTNDAPIVTSVIPNQTDQDDETISTLNVSSYFNDPDQNDNLTFSALGLPTGLSIDAAGNISGQLDDSASQGGPLGDGVYTVTVTANDGNGGTVDQTFTWTITNPGPDAADDFGSTTQSATTSGNVITDLAGQDTDVDGDNIVVSEIDGNSANVSNSVTGSNGGQFTITSTGAYTFDPNGDFDTLADGETATTSISYTISDGEGGTDVATLLITVTGENDNPTMVGSIPDQLDEDSAAITTIDTVAFFDDIDATDSLTFSVSGLPDGLVFNTSNGQISGAPDNDASQGGPLGDGVYTVIVTANDGNGGTVDQTFTWTITNPGPDAADDFGSTTQSATTSGNVITGLAGQDTDIDGDNIAVSAVDGNSANVSNSVTGSNGGQFTITSTGAFTFDPNGDFDTLADGETATTSVEYTISDGEGGTDTATLQITITGENDAPTTNGTIPNQTDVDNFTIPTLNISSNFSDVDTNDSLTFLANGLPTGLSMDSSGNITGQIDNSASQNGPTNDGVFQVTITSSDGNGGFVDQTFTWTVTNPGPDATDDFGSTTQSATTSGNVITDLAGQDTDVDGDNIAVSAIEGMQSFVNVPVVGDNGGEFTIDTDGSYSFNPNGDFDSLADGESATTSVSYTITDSEGGTDVATLEITITGENDTPTQLGTIPDQASLDNETISTLNISGYFADIDNGALLDFTAAGLPNGLVIDSNGNITGTVSNSESLTGSFSVTVTATDEHGSSVDQTFNWTVTNPGPTAVNDTDSTTEVTSTAGNVITASDSDSDGDDITVHSVNGSTAHVASQVAGTTGGLFTINVNGGYSFDPNGEFQDLAEGETRDTVVTYEITDSEGGFASATLTITVVGVNDNPVASGTIPDQINLDADAITPLNISSHFSDPDASDDLEFSAIDLPPGLTIDETTGIISGTIDNSASLDGPFNVVVTATDPQGATVALSFDWTVTNPGPTATDNTNSVTSGGSTTGTGNVITDNDGAGIDSDADGDDLGVSSFDGSTANVGIQVAGDYGTIEVDSLGNYTYTLDETNPDVISLSGSETLIETFEYIVADGEGGFATANLTITINGQNDAPVFGGTIPSQADLDADTISTLDVSTFFSDPDGDTLTYSATGLPAGLTIDEGTGEITGDIDNSASQGGPLNDGVYSVQVTANDGNGGSVTSTFEWTVGNPGPAATANTNSVTEDAVPSSATGNVITDNDGNGIDSDPDGDSLTVISLNGSTSNVGNIVTGTYGEITLASNGNYTYTLDNNNAAVNALDNGDILAETFTYVVTDSEGGTASSTLTITINGANDAPITGATIPAQSDNDFDTITPLNISTAFSDPDGDALTYIATGLPAGISLDEDTGIISGTIDNSASQGGPLNDGVYTVLVTATDDNGATVQSTFTWTVGNPAPTATDNNGSVTEDTVSTATGNLISDNDGAGFDSDPDGDDLTVSVFSGTASYGTIVTTAQGEYTYTLNNSHPDVDALDNGEFLIETFTYTVTDSEGGTSEATLTITINGTNDQPIAGGTIPPQSDMDGDTVSPVDISTAFSDPDGDTLTYSATGLPSGLTIDEVTGMISGVINNSASQGGPYDVEITATDDNGASVTTTFTWTVGNPGPTATDNSGNVVAGDATNTETGNVLTDNDGFGADNDPDDDELMVNAVLGSSANVGIAVNGFYGSLVLNDEGDYTYMLDNNNPAVVALDAGQAVQDLFTYTITDNEGGTSTATLTITIDGANDAPVVGGTIPNQSDADAEAIATVDVKPAFSDPDGDSPTYTATGLPDGLALDPDTGLITGTLDNSASQSGPYTVEVTATDDSAASVSTTFSWTVTNPGPAAQDDFDSTTQSALANGNVITDPGGTDSDVDGDEITVFEVNGSTALVATTLAGTNGGEFTINGDGSYSFNPNGEFDSLADGESVVTSINYTVTDSEGGIASATLEITVNGENDEPTLVGSIPDQANVDLDTIATIDTSGFFADGDTTDVFTYSASGLPTGLEFNTATGEITGTIDNSASQDGPLNDGVFNVTITANDGNGGNVDQSFTWTVTNPGPDAIDDAGATDQNTNTSGNVVTLDTDPDNDTITVNSVNGSSANVGSLVAGSNGGQFLVNSTGAFGFIPNGDFDHLAEGETETTSITYSITDSEGGTDSATLTITVTGTNDTPTIFSAIPDRTGVDGSTVTPIDISSHFTDVDDTDSLTFAATGLPDGLTMSSGGIITGTIDNSESLNGPFTITVTATDSLGATVQQDFTWTVTNPGPTAFNNAAVVAEDTQLVASGNVISDEDGFGTDFDTDNDAILVSAVENDDANVGIEVDGTYGTIEITSTGSYTYTLNNTHADVDALDVGETLSETFSYTISDGEGGFDTAQVTITIQGSNDAPVANGTIADQDNFDLDSIASVDVSSAFSDPEGDTLTYSATGLPSGLTIDEDTGFISGTINNNASTNGPTSDGTYPVTVTATDDNGETVTSTFTWNVENISPTAGDDGFTTDEDTPITSSVTGNDNDVDNDELTYTVVNGTTNGTLNFNDDGSFTYTPDLNYSGTDSFDYEIRDEDGATAIATVTIDVNEVNDDPVVNTPIPDQANFDSDDINLDVSSNFSDPEGQPLTFSATGLPTGLDIDDNGNITGTIHSSASQGGTYIVVITAEDPSGDTVTDTFSWSIENLAPTATNDSYTTDEDVSFNGDVSDLDSDPDGDSLTFAQTSNPSLGIVTFNPNGTFTYDPNPGVSGNDSFDYVAIDADGAQTAATVFISIGDVNDLPSVVTPIPDQTSFDADDISINIAASFNDVDGDTLTFTATDLPPGLSMDSAGHITGTIDINASQFGPYTVIVTADDGLGGQNTDTFTWTVTNPTPIAQDDSFSTDEDTPVTDTVIGNDSDPDGDAMSYSLSTGPTNGQLTLDANGTFTYTPDADFFGTDTFEYEACDADGACVTATVTIDVQPINDQPVANAIPDQADLDSDEINVDFSGFFSDIDADTLAFTATGLPTGLSIDSSGVVTGTIDSSASQTGTFAVTITADDRNGETVEQSLAWTVTNPGPIAEDDGFVTNEDVPVSGTVFGNDSDPDGDSTTFALVSGPFNGSVDFNSDGTFDYTPNENFHSIDTFVYEIFDADGASTTATVTITVDPVNDAPTVDNPIPDQDSFDINEISLDVSTAFSDIESNVLGYSATGLPLGLSIDPSTGLITGTIDSSASEDGPYTVIITADDGLGGTATDTFTWNVANVLPVAQNDNFTTDEDTPFSDSVANNDTDLDDSVMFTLLNTPSNGTLTFNSDGSFTYTPDANYNGFDSFDYELCDADGDCVLATASIAIGSVNDPPVVTTPMPDQSDMDADVVVVDVKPNFNDPDGDVLTYTATGLPPGLSIDETTGIITGMIASGASSGGPYTVVVTATDPLAASTSDTFTWHVGNPGPIAQDDSYSGTEDSPVSGDVATNDADPDGDALSFTVISGPSNGDVTLNSDGTFTYSPNADFFGNDSFTYMITDADGDTSTAVATINIAPENDAPVANDDSRTTAEDTPVTVGVIANDHDADHDPLMVSIIDEPMNGTVFVNLDGSIEYTPDQDYVGTETFVYQISDMEGQTSNAVVTIEVTPSADPPVASDDDYSTDEEVPLFGTVAANDYDPDGESLTFSLQTAPTTGDLVFNPDGTFIYTPSADFNGQVTFEYLVTDPTGRTNDAVATIDVLPVNDAPTALNDNETTTQDQVVVVDLVSNDFDNDSAELTVVEINGVSVSPGDTLELASGAVLTLNANGTVSYDPNGSLEALTQGQTAIDSFEYTVVDGDGEPATATAFITINGENDAPVAEDDFIKTTVDTSVTISVLGNDYEPENEQLSVVLLNQPTNGTATVNPDGTITYVPDEAYEGTDHLHYLVEDPMGATSEATVTVEVEPDFRFDAFTNFSQTHTPVDTTSVEYRNSPGRQIISQKIFTLAPEPIFSGYARPGTQIVGRIYDASGNLVGESTAFTDSGGNWLMQMQGTRGHQFHRIEFEQVATTGGADIYGYFGLDPADNSYQAMEAMTSYDKPLSVEAAMIGSIDTIKQSHQQSNNPLGFGR